MPRQPPIDMLNDPLKEIVYVRKNRPTFKKLARETHFTLSEVEGLAVIHKKICEDRGPMTRLVLRDLLHSGLDYTETYRHLLIDRVFSTLASQNSLQLHLQQWVKGLSIFLRGSLEERINFAYRVYDLMMTGKIGKEQIYPSMRGCLINMGPDEDPKEAVKELIDLMVKTLDVDRDGYINRADFKTAVQKDPLLLEALGPVFPSGDFCYAFSTTFSWISWQLVISDRELDSKSHHVTDENSSGLKRNAIKIIYHDSSSSRYIINGPIFQGPHI